MELFWSKSTGGFYSGDIHGRNMPTDAVKITPKRHAELVKAHQGGADIVAGGRGLPEARERKSTRETALGEAALRVKREARRRCLIIASLERQSNDNAALAMLRPGEPEFDAALERRTAINAVRAASDEIERYLNGLPAVALSSFDAKNAAGWPSI